MNMSLSRGRFDYLLKQRNAMLILVLALLGLNVLQALQSILRDERIVIVPPDVRKEFWMQKNSVSPAYLEEMALFYADLVLEATPHSAAFKREIILRNTAAESYSPLKRQLLEDEEAMKKDHVSTTFYPNSVSVDVTQKRVTLKGDLMRYVGEKRISQSRDDYEINFDYRHGRLLIKSFKLLRSDENAQK